MHALDSRYLNLTNYFAHRFTTAGTFSYGLSPLPSFLVEPDSAEDELSIVVRPERGAGQQQHDIVVSRGNDGVTARPGRLEIALGDVVGWSTDGTMTTGFAVRGRIGDMTVDSSAMTDESIFTHAFGSPGEYRWADAHGSTLYGTVQVVRPEPGDKRHAGWTAELGRGTLVHVTGERAEPETVEILVGQTVFWAVQKAPGISITDVTLLPGSRGT